MIGHESRDFVNGIVITDLDAWIVKEIFRDIMRRMYFEHPGKAEITRLRHLLCLKNKAEIGVHFGLDLKLG